MIANSEKNDLRKNDDRRDLQCETLEPRVMLSTVQIFAAGTTGAESIDLQIDNNTVATYTSPGSGANNGDYQTFNYSTPDNVTADQIRIAFTNDLYDPGNNVDRNVRIDRIVIDGQTFQTEDPGVFSTGTWKAADGVTPGFRESEFLHANGYFQYAGGSPPTGPGNVVIDEIHYNPGPDGTIDGDAGFIELYNSGGESVDLSGMSFVGFELTFGAGITLGAGQYAILLPSISIAQAEWGVTPIAEFASGGISGGGETIQLIAADGVTVVDEISYDDASPWPGGPDGNGPSLELINPEFDNNAASSWATSEGSPTPGAQNSVFDTEPAVEVTGIRVSDAATMRGATFGNLIYKVVFGEEVTVQMDNTFDNRGKATIPGQSVGTLGCCLWRSGDRQRDGSGTWKRFTCLHEEGFQVRATQRSFAGLRRPCIYSGRRIRNRFGLCRLVSRKRESSWEIWNAETNSQTSTFFTRVEQNGDFGGNAGDYSSRNFTELTYNSDTSFDASDVRVHFVNDTYNPGAGIDYNLRVDKIEIDGVAFETDTNTLPSNLPASHFKHYRTVQHAPTMEA